MTWSPENPGGPPVRLQLSRKAGFWLHGMSVELNGRHAVSVARPSKWGNPYKVSATRSAAEAVAMFRETMTLAMHRPPERRPPFEELRGKNLACWCKLPSPGKPDVCHAAVLLELANQ